MFLVPVRRPLPHVARQIIETIAIRWKCTHWGRPLEFIKFQVLPGELALPSVGHPLPAGSKLISPNELRTVKSAAGGKLPFGFGRQLFPRPLDIGFRVFVRDMHYRVVPTPFE